MCTKVTWDISKTSSNFIAICAGHEEKFFKTHFDLASKISDLAWVSKSHVPLIFKRKLAWTVWNARLIVSCVFLPLTFIKAGGLNTTYLYVGKTRVWCNFVSGESCYEEQADEVSPQFLKSEIKYRKREMTKFVFHPKWKSCCKSLLPSEKEFH